MISRPLFSFKIDLFYKRVLINVRYKVQIENKKLTDITQLKLIIIQV